MNGIATSDWLTASAAVPDAKAREAAAARQAILTKPAGALGRLEELAVHLAGLLGTARPRIERVHITVFAGDHGVAAEGISAFPQIVTAEMVKNFASGGAAISVAARTLGAALEVINLGTACDTGPIDGVTDARLGPGTANFTAAPAMTEHQLARAVAVGCHAAERALAKQNQLFIGGEMGIGNTTAAAALACALLDAQPEHLAGPGTGLDHAGVAHKRRIIRRALEFHDDRLSSPREALRRLGGFEIAALAGSYISCAHIGLPVLVDGFISSVAALFAARLCPGAREWFVFSHTSAEPGHRQVLEALDARPLLDLGMRLGEGSGAAVAVPLLRMACSLHNEMATFADAEVSGRV